MERTQTTNNNKSWKNNKNYDNNKWDLIRVFAFQNLIDHKYFIKTRWNLVCVYECVWVWLCTSIKMNIFILHFSQNFCIILWCFYYYYNLVVGCGYCCCCFTNVKKAAKKCIILSIFNVNTTWLFMLLLLDCFLNTRN